MSMDVLEVIQVVFFMAVLSYVFKPNPIHRIVESLFIGCVAGYNLVVNFDRVYRETIIRIPNDILLMIPIILSVMMYFRLVKKYAWVSNYPIAFLTAIGLGVSTRTIIQTDIIGQIRDTFLPLIVPTSALNTFNNLIVIIGVLTAISYFFYTFEHKGPLGISANVGMTFLMITFGAGFAQGLLSRIGRWTGAIMFLIVPSAIYVVPIMVVIILISIYLEKKMTRTV